MPHFVQSFPVPLLQALLIFAIVGVAHATPSISDGRRLYAPCGICHQPKAWGSPDGTIPNLAGQQKRYLERQFSLFSSGARGSGEHLRVGQELYTHICAACHGVGGAGQSGNRVPRIGGQHFPYLSRQIEAGATLHKDLAPPK
jgi:cytochrome c553